MNRDRFSTIAHRDHAFCSPLSSTRVDRLIELLDLPPNAHVLDLGCGKAELLRRVVARYGARGVGVDRNAEFLAEARARADHAALSPTSLVLHHADVATFDVAPGHYDLVINVGATAPYGGSFSAALTAAASGVRAGGAVLVGEGFWRKPPSPEYLDLLGAKPEDFTDHAGNVACGEAVGLTPMFAVVSREDDWDEYEGLYARAVERFVRAHPDDPDAGAMRSRIGRWREGYLRWGRETLGFALYLFAK